MRTKLERLTALSDRVYTRLHRSSRYTERFNIAEMRLRKLRAIVVIEKTVARLEGKGSI